MLLGERPANAAAAADFHGGHIPDETEEWMQWH